MKVTGTATRPTTERTIVLKNPRQGETPTKTVYETVVLDDSLGQTVTLTSWNRNGPTWAKGEDVDAEISAIRIFLGRIQATLPGPDSE